VAAPLTQGKNNGAACLSKFEMLYEGSIRHAGKEEGKEHLEVRLFHHPMHTTIILGRTTS